MLISCSPRFFSRVVPEPGASIRDSLVVVKVRVAEPIDLSSFDVSSIIMSGTKTGPLKMRIRFDSDSSDIVITVIDSLHRDEHIDVVLTDRIRRKSGGNVPHGIRWRFWVSPGWWQLDYQGPDSTYTREVHDLPAPVGGIAEIWRNVIYPFEAKKLKIEGTVYLEAFIDETGKVDDVRVVKGIGGGCDESAMQAIYATRFAAGKVNGKPVKVRMTIPIRFRLER